MYVALQERCSPFSEELKYHDAFRTRNQLLYLYCVWAKSKKISEEVGGIRVAFQPFCFWSGPTDRMSNNGFDYEYFDTVEF